MFSSLTPGRRLVEFDDVFVEVDENVEVMAQNGRGLQQRVVRGQAAIGPDFEDELVVIGALTDAGVFDRVFHAGHRRENGIDRDQTDRLVGALVFVAGGETASDAHFEFGVELMLLVERADELFRVQDVVTLHDLDVAGGDFAFLVHGESEFARLVIGGLEFHPLQIEHDVGDVLDHARKGGELVLRAGDLYRGDGSAFERGKENAAEGISDGVAVTGFKRLGDKLGVGISG